MTILANILLVIAVSLGNAATEPLLDIPDEPVGGEVYNINEVIGVSTDFGAWALRHVSYGEAMTGLGSSCRYPKVRGRRPASVILVLCVVGKGCEQGFPIYDHEDSDAGCTSPTKASERLAVAKAEFAEAGVDLTKQAVPLRTVSVKKWGLGWAGREQDVVLEIPAEALEQFGMTGSAGVTSRRVRKGPICGVVVEKDGYGSTTLVSHKRWSCVGGMSLEAAAVTPDGKRLLVTYWTGHFDVDESDTHARSFPLAHVAARLFNSRGFHSHKAKRIESAANDFARALELDPKYGQAAFNLSCAHALLGQTDSALAALEAALHLDKKTFASKAKNDNDLTSIKKDPRFREMLE